MSGAHNHERDERCTDDCIYWHAALPPAATPPPEPADGVVAYIHEPCGSLATAQWINEWAGGATRTTCQYCPDVGMEGWTPLIRTPASGVSGETRALVTIRELLAEEAARHARGSCLCPRTLFGELNDILAALAPGPDTACTCEPCPGRGHDGHGMEHCAECCFGTGVRDADPECPIAKHRELSDWQHGGIGPGPDTARDGEALTVEQVADAAVEMHDSLVNEQVHIAAERDAARRELGEFKTAVERLCDEAERQYPPFLLVPVDDLRALLTQPDAGRDVGEEK